MKKLQIGELKADGTAYTPEEIKANNEMVEFLEGINKDILAKTITIEQGLQKVNEAIAEANKSHSDFVDKMTKTLEKQQNLIKQLESKGLTEMVEKTVEQVIAENETELKALFANKQPNQLFSITKAAAASTTSNTLDTTALGTSIMESYRRVDGFVETRFPNQFIFDIADRTTSPMVEENIIWTEQGNEEGAFAVVAEGALKPLVQDKLVEKTTKAKKVAGREIVTTEFEKFRKRIHVIIKRLFNDRLLRKYQDIATADMIALTTPFVLTSITGVTNISNYDAIGAVCAQLESLEYMPDVLIMNPIDKWKTLLSKGSDGHSIVASVPVVGANGTLSIMSLKTHFTNKLAVDSFIVGESKLLKIEDSQVELKLGYSGVMNGSTLEMDMDYNRMTMIAELFYHLYIPSNRQGGFVKTTFAAVKAAIV